ncbi:DUF1003 domain-containing protein [Deinococcus altitudinis]|uniref:DUF1003 domain-containing protein n=1 Tax=Deinococcus altitudinis TaxID=468914 RepID=UPI0038927FA5
MARSEDSDALLRQIVGENASVNDLLRQHHEAEASNLHRPIEQFARLVANPQFIVAFLSLFSLWVWINTDLVLNQKKAWDQPPFFWLQGVVGLLALAITSAVLVTQTRQARLAEQRADVQLQIILLTGQRTAKLIELVEELRRDLPNVQNRRDEQAEALQRVTTPGVILEALQSAEAED